MCCRLVPASCRDGVDHLVTPFKARIKPTVEIVNRLTDSVGCREMEKLLAKLSRKNSALLEAQEQIMVLQLEVEQQQESSLKLEIDKEVLEAEADDSREDFRELMKLQVDSVLVEIHKNQPLDAAGSGGGEE